MPAGGSYFMSSVSFWGNDDDDTEDSKVRIINRYITKQILDYLERKIITADEAEQMMNGVDIDIESRLAEPAEKPIRVIRTD